MAIRPVRSSRPVSWALVAVLHAALALLFRLPWSSTIETNSPVSASLLQEQLPPALPTVMPPPDLRPVVLAIADPQVALPAQQPEIEASAQAVTVEAAVEKGGDGLPSPQLELALACPSRTPPVYPPQSRRLREQGSVWLRVELDDQGYVATATVERSSGSPRLDEAARTAVLRWKCQAAMRAGRPVRSVAAQEFAFVLEARAASTANH